MARGILTVQNVVKAGLSPALAAASTYTDGDSFPNDGRTFLWIKNSSTSVTVTITTTVTTGGYAVADQTCAVASTDTNGKFLGPFDPNVFNDANGYVNIDYGTATTNITHGAFRLP
jgi:hypothetical protein